MKKLFSMAAVALLLIGVSFAQQEVSPDRFEGDVARPAKVKHVSKATNARMMQTKHHPGRPATKAALSVKPIAGN